MYSCGFLKVLYRNRPMIFVLWIIWFMYMYYMCGNNFCEMMKGKMVWIKNIDQYELKTVVRSETKLKICRGLWGGSAHRRVAPSLAVRQGRVPQYYDDEADNRPLCDLLISSPCTGGLMMREPPSSLQPHVDLSLSPLLNSLKKLVACSCCVVNTLNLFDIIPMRKLIHSSFCSRVVQSSDLRFVKARTRRSL